MNLNPVLPQHGFLKIYTPVREKINQIRKQKGVV